MERGFEHIFRVLDGETGDEIITGTSKECGLYFGKSAAYIYNIWKRNRKPKDYNFYVERIGMRLIDHSPISLANRKRLRKEKSEKTVKQESMKSYERVKTHLDIYGNTFTNRDPKSIVERLIDEGYLVNVEHRPKRKSSNEIWPEIYIISCEN